MAGLDGANTHRRRSTIASIRFVLRISFAVTLELVMDMQTPRESGAEANRRDQAHPVGDPLPYSDRVLRWILALYNYGLRSLVVLEGRRRRQGDAT